MASGSGPGKICLSAVLMETVRVRDRNLDNCCQLIQAFPQRVITELCWLMITVVTITVFTITVFTITVFTITVKLRSIHTPPRKATHGNPQLVVCFGMSCLVFSKVGSRFCVASPY